MQHSIGTTEMPVDDLKKIDFIFELIHSLPLADLGGVPVARPP